MCRVKQILMLVLWLLSGSFKFPDEKRFLSRKAANIVVFDANGNSLELFSLLRNKPLIIAPVYTGCPSVCGILSNGTLRAINELGTLGKDFNVVSFSFDSVDNKETLASYESRWSLDGHNWKAISASPASIQTLTGSIDFQYDYNATTKEYDHPSLLVVLSPEGRISRYIYGINPDKRDIKLAVIEAAAERTSPGIFKGLYLKCFAFDSLTKTYRVDWGFIISTFAGLLIITIICTLFIKSFVILKKSG
jgi:protein SCO1/2